MGGPPDKTSQLSTFDFVGNTADDFNNAVTTLYQAGYEYAFDVPDPNHTGYVIVEFQGYKAGQ